MKGYFTSLAKQSGLRVSRQKTGARVSPEITGDPFSTPPHREETVLVPPPRASRRMESAPAPGPRQTVKSDEKAVAPVYEKPPAVDIAGPGPGEKKTGGVREVRIVEPAKTETIFIEAPKPPAAEEMRPAAGDMRSAGEPPPGITVVEHRGFVEQEMAPAILADPPEKPAPGKPSLPETVITETIEQPRFFVKTAELVEKGETGPEDIGSILFQEVRQWVASGPPEPDAAAPPPEVLETLTVRDAQPKEAGPGTVVIRERADRESPGGQAALEEQNFNLSIGTISVIIEDPERGPEPVRVIQNERSQNTSTGTKREFSRFSRNYL